MKPPAFEYQRATSAEEAVAMLAAAGADAKLIAGGQSLVPMLNFRLLRPSVLVDVHRIATLNGVAEIDGGLRIGALTRHFTLETSPLVKRYFPVIAEAMRHVAHLAIRNRGTIGGSLSHADPAAELPMLALLLDARIQTLTPNGARTLSAREFLVGALTTALGETEMVTAIDLPALRPATGWGFEEFARRMGDYALAACACTVSVDAGRAADVRIALMGVGDTAVRASAAEAMLTGQVLDQARIVEASHAAAAALRPMTDLQASAEYRRHLAQTLIERALHAAWDRANGRIA